MLHKSFNNVALVCNTLIIILFTFNVWALTASASNSSVPAEVSPGKSSKSTENIIEISGLSKSVKKDLKPAVADLPQNIPKPGTNNVDTEYDAKVNSKQPQIEINKGNENAKVEKEKLSAVESDNNDQATTFTNSTNKNFDVPYSFMYIFAALGLLAILYIIFRTYRLRLSRAERRYGVQGDRRTQELTPLPMAIEDDSETEDQTLFEINRQTVRLP